MWEGPNRVGTAGAETRGERAGGISPGAGGWYPRGVDIVCERCGARVPAEDIDLPARLAKCRSCQGVFDFSRQLGRPRVRAVPLATTQPVAPQPGGITVVEDIPAPERESGYRTAPAGGGRLVMRRSWYSHQIIFLAFFCLIWDGFLITWYKVLLGAERGPGFFFFVFPLLHVAVGVGLTYRTLAGFLNKTWITVAGGELTIRHGPLPWFGNRAVPSAEIGQLYCEQSVIRNRNSTSVSYNLCAVLRDGRKVDLIKSLPSEQALYLEHRIEEHLGIEPAPVAGEFRG